MERIDLDGVEHRLHRLWVRGRRGDIGHAVIGYGQTAAGDWFAVRFERRRQTMAWLAWDEGHAGDVVQRWINARGGMGIWSEVPANAVGVAPESTA